MTFQAKTLIMNMSFYQNSKNSLIISAHSSPSSFYMTVLVIGLDNLNYCKYFNAPPNYYFFYYSIDLITYALVRL